MTPTLLIALIRRIGFIATTLLSASLSYSAHTAETNTANQHQKIHTRTLAASCAACHGTQGNSHSIIPVLAGLDATYFSTQMLAFKNRSRTSTVMHHHALGLTADEIEQLSHYFSQQARISTPSPAPQTAGKPAQMTDLLEPDYPWCEVNFLSNESKRVPDVHVIGDSVAAGLPKSAHVATSQARVCASAIVELMNRCSPNPAPVFSNTCYSFVDGKRAMHIANVYRYDAGKKIMVSEQGGGVSASPSEQEGKYANAWASNIWSDVLT
jgi:cytochrome c553